MFALWVVCPAGGFRCPVVGFPGWVGGLEERFPAFATPAEVKAMRWVTSNSLYFSLNRPNDEGGCCLPIRRIRRYGHPRSIDSCSQSRKGVNMPRDYRERITLDPKIHFGKPCVAETRIPVEDVLELIQEGISFAEIIQKYYPVLELDDVKACAKYATELVKAEEIHVETA